MFAIRLRRACEGSNVRDMTIALAALLLVAPYLFAGAAGVAQSRKPITGEPNTAREDCTAGVWDCPVWVTEAHAIR